MAGLRELLFPLRPRREGQVFDGFVSNLAADRFPLEQLGVPTLVISARDDPLAPYRFAAAAAPRIPEARLMTIERGGHLFLGHHAVVRKEISAFIASAGPGEASPRRQRCQSRKVPDGPVSTGPLPLMTSWRPGETGITGLAGMGEIALRPIPLRESIAAASRPEFG
jgi:hypothetical protein